jgi:hypothetical protein
MPLAFGVSQHSAWPQIFEQGIALFCEAGNIREKVCA